MRIFLAIEIPENIKKKLAEAQEKLRSEVPCVRWEKPEKLHITLVFLGEVVGERAGELEEAARKGIKGVRGFKVGFSEVDIFPKGKRPRVVLLEIGEGREEVERLQKRLAEALAREGFEFAKLSKPHITLGRFKQQRYPTRRVDKAQPRLGNGNSTRRVGRSFRVKEVVIVESKLHPTGAIHTPIGRINLTR